MRGLSSIRVRVLLALLGVLAATALVLGLSTYRGVLAETESLFDYQLRQMAFSLRDQGEIAPAQASSLADAELDFVVQIWTVDGRVIYPPRAREDVPAQARLGLADVSVRGQLWRTFSVASRDRVIQVAQPRLVRKRLAADAALRSVTPIALIAPALGLLVWWLAAQALAPLRRVAVDLAARDEQSLRPLPVVGLPDEVLPLVGALNGLLQRLGTSLEAQRAFVSDAAHELRSPLTALKLQLQWLQRAGDAAGRAEAIAALGAGIERAARLVEQMLTLARAEPGAPPTRFSMVDLAGSARDAMAATEPLAAERGTTIALLAPVPVRVDGDPAALEAMVRNLVDNAIRYAPRGARVEVRVADEGEAGVLLRVDDAGPGIPPAERERVFDRFYRHAAGDEDGTGLGLAIVRGVAERHRAEVVLGESPLGGLGVEVRMPGAARGATSGPGAEGESLPARVTRPADENAGGAA